MVEFVQSDGTLNGLTWAQFGQAFSNFVVPAGQTVNSGPFPNVLLTQGAIPSLDIIPFGILDISAGSTVRVGGAGGYQVPWLKIEQKAVPTSYDLVLGLAALKAKAKEMANSTVSASASSTASASASEAESSAHASSTAAGDSEPSGKPDDNKPSADAPHSAAQPEKTDASPSPAPAAEPAPAPAKATSPPADDSKKVHSVATNDSDNP